MSTTLPEFSSLIFVMCCRVLLPGGDLPIAPHPGAACDVFEKTRPSLGRAWRMHHRAMTWNMSRGRVTPTRGMPIDGSFEFDPDRYLSNRSHATFSARVPVCP